MNADTTRPDPTQGPGPSPATPSAARATDRPQRRRGRIIHIIRTNRIPFIESRPSWPLALTSVVVVAIGIWLPVSPLATALGFVPLPMEYWPLLAGILVAYALLTQAVTVWFVRRLCD